MKSIAFVPVALFAFVLTSCSVALNYVGKSYAPTGRPELFFSWNEVSREYETMGYVDAVPINLGTIEKAQTAIEKKARECGADAIVFENPFDRALTLTEKIDPDAAGSEKRTVMATGSTARGASSLRATFIKYK